MFFQCDVLPGVADFSDNSLKSNPPYIAIIQIIAHFQRDIMFSSTRARVVMSPRRVEIMSIEANKCGYVITRRDLSLEKYKS